MTCNIYLLLLLFIQQTGCSGQFSTLPSSTTVSVGGDASFECTASSGGEVAWDIRRGINTIFRIANPNASDISTLDVDRALLLGPLGSPLVLEGVGQGMDGIAAVCLAQVGLIVVTQDEPFAILTVLFPPEYSIDPSQSTAVIEGANEYTYRFMLAANPIPAVFTWMKGSAELSNTSRIGLTVDSITIRDVLRSDAGLYTVTASHAGASATANFTLDVMYPPSYGSEKNASQTVVEGATLTIDCTPVPGNPSSTNVTISFGSSHQLDSNNGVLTISPVQKRHTGTYTCTASNGVGQDPVVIIPVTVNAPPSAVFNGSYQTKEGENFVVLSTSFDAGFPKAFVTVRRGGSALTNGTDVTILVDDSVLRMEFAGVVRTLQGTSYEVTVMNSVNSSSASFDLDVIYPPEFSGVDLVRSTQLDKRSSFTFNCTPSAANPAPSFSFMTNGSTYTEPAGNINGPILTISSVVRADTGNYSCTATNTAGSTTLYHNLLVVAPPTSPLNLMFSGDMAFSAMVMWTPPTDDGGISHPSWTPPSPSSSPIIQYTGTYSNSSGSWSIDNQNTSLVRLTNLQHSTDYTVTVAASNVHGQSTAVQGTFRTLDSKPILQAVVLAPLGLNNFTANVTFLTVGGQDVTSFSITINDSSPTVVDSTPVPDGKGVIVSLLIEGRSFTKGTYYTVEITATNSVGTSEPITGLMFVPNPPVITANFTEVSADDIPSNKCCAGVRLMLAEQPDVSDLIVLLTPQGGNQSTVNAAELSLNGSVLYIGGLQAGTNYTAVVTVSNIFGSSDDQLQLQPLLGVPSNPNPPTVSVNGGQVTVELSTAYPGTVQTRSGSMFRFEIQFIEDSQRSSRQSKTEMLPVTLASLFNTSATLTTNLDPGSYSVSVTAVNEHGRSSAVMSNSTFSVEAPTGDITITIIIAIVVVVVLVLIVLIIAIVCIICCIRVKKNKKEKYHVGSEDTELTTNRNAVEKNGLDGDRNSFVETGIYDEVGKETKKPPKPQSTPASTTNGQPQPGGDIYAEVNKPKKTNNAAATPTTPPTGDVYAAVDMSQKTKKPKIEAPADKVDPEATLYAEVVQEKKEPAVPPKTDAKYQNPEVDKPIEENELQYAALDFSKAPSSFKKPAPPNPDENVIYSEVTIAKKH